MHQSQQCLSDVASVANLKKSLTRLEITWGGYLPFHVTSRLRNMLTGPQLLTFLSFPYMLSSCSATALCLVCHHEGCHQTGEGGVGPGGGGGARRGGRGPYVGAP